MRSSPIVSVIVPNYNYAEYLPERIGSILKQSFQDFEIIILDDASKDGSVSVINSYLFDKRIITNFNSSNSGNPFIQWEKGVSMAKGKYVWIAEADDFSDPGFLELLVSIMEKNSKINIAYCQSLTTDSNGITKGTMHSYTDKIWPERWKSDFLNKGSDEVINYLSYKNTIPNASAVVMRKEPLKKILPEAKHLRYCGDWYSYVSLLKYGDIYFSSELKNYFRTHSESVRSELSGSVLHIKERYLILEHIRKNFDLPKKTFSDILESISYNWVEFSKERSLKFNDPANKSILRTALISDPYAKSRFYKKKIFGIIKDIIKSKEKSE